MENTWKVKRYMWLSEHVNIMYLIQVLEVEKNKNGAQLGLEGIFNHGKRHQFTDPTNPTDSSLS